jgi:hypothetical protein
LPIAARPLAVVAEPAYRTAEVPERRLRVTVILLVHVDVCVHVAEFLQGERAVAAVLEFRQVFVHTLGQVEFSFTDQFPQQDVERRLGNAHPVVPLTGVHPGVLLEHDLAVPHHDHSLAVQTPQHLPHG